jgi:hypothetical protein
VATGYALVLGSLLLPAGGLLDAEADVGAPFKIRISAMTSGYYRTSSPVTALPMITRWISDVPSKMVKILASLCQRSTG